MIAQLFRKRAAEERVVIMKKTYNIEVDCANCAAKMQEGISQISGVQSVSVNFLLQRLTLEADDAEFDKILAQAVKVCKRIEPDCRIKV